MLYICCGKLFYIFLHVSTFGFLVFFSYCLVMLIDLAEGAFHTSAAINNSVGRREVGDGFSHNGIGGS